jgi:hypothetical protein
MQLGHQGDLAMLTSHDLNHLRSLAAPVNQPQPGKATLGAKGAACALSGVVRLVTTKHGLGVMQRSCAKLALLGTPVGPAPGEATGEATELLAAAADGLAAVAGRDNARAALAFWACETDPAVWRDVAAAA